MNSKKKIENSEGVTENNLSKSLFTAKGLDGLDHIGVDHFRDFSIASGGGVNAVGKVEGWVAGNALQKKRHQDEVLFGRDRRVDALEGWGKTETAVEVGLKQFDEVYIGTEIVEADAYVSVAHFKGHELSGFGGAIKNTGMGCASRRGKMAQHSTLSPKVKTKKCIGCGDCVPHCAQSALEVVDEKCRLDPERCIGCGECILACPTGAIQIRWNQDIPTFLENMVEYTAGVLKNKKGKALFINFITDVSPGCDCLPFNDTPIVRNIGILAATDPVAIDQASVDLVNREPALPGADMKTNQAAGEDKFRGVYPDVDWAHQLVYAEKIGLGKRKYELVKI